MARKRAKRPAAKPAAHAPAEAAQSAAASPGRWLVPVLIVAVFSFGIFQLPYHTKVVGPNGSQSWEFGFNNTTAHESIALMLLALFGWLLFSRRREAGEPALMKVLNGENQRGSTKGLWIVAAAVAVINAAVLASWYNVLPYTHYGEFTYFIQRVEAAVTGRVPYRDFAFDYGPVMLAVPVGLYHLFGGRISVEQAYFTTLLLHFTAGFALLAYIVSRMRMARDHALVFLLVAIPFINLTMGLNYTPLRFGVALSAMFAIRHLYVRAREGVRYCWGLLALGAFAFPIVNFAISPEMGLALTIGLLVYFGWFLFGAERRLALLGLLVIGGVGVAVLLFPRAYFDSMLSFGKGGASFPIFPTIHIVAFLLAAIWVIPRLGVVAIREEPGVGAFAAGMAVLMGLFILPAMGRCDSGHVYLNGLGLFLLALAAATWVKTGPRLAVLIVFFLIFSVVDQITFWDHYQGSIQSAITVRDQLANAHYTADNAPAPGQPPPRIHYSKLLPMPEWFDQLPKAPIGLPVGADEALERYLMLTGRMTQEYHIAPFGDIFEPSQLDSKYADLAKMKYIYIPKTYVAFGQVNPDDYRTQQASGDCEFMSSLMLFPISLPGVHEIFKPEFPLMHRILAEYQAVQEFPDGYLMLRAQ